MKSAGSVWIGSGGIQNKTTAHTHTEMRLVLSVVRCGALACISRHIVICACMLRWMRVLGRDSRAVLTCRCRRCVAQCTTRHCSGKPCDAMRCDAMRCDAMRCDATRAWAWQTHDGATAVGFGAGARRGVLVRARVLWCGLRVRAVAGTPTGTPSTQGRAVLIDRSTAARQLGSARLDRARNSRHVCAQDSQGTHGTARTRGTHGTRWNGAFVPA